MKLSTVQRQAIRAIIVNALSLEDMERKIFEACEYISVHNSRRYYVPEYEVESFIYNDKEFSSLMVRMEAYRASLTDNGTEWCFE